MSKSPRYPAGGTGEFPLDGHQAPKAKCGGRWRLGDNRKIKRAGKFLIALALLLSGCAFQRAEIAQDARAQMVGMSREQVLACMGAPASKAAEGATEVWGYDSGNGMTVVNASYDRYGGTAVGSSRFCKINIVFGAGQVSAVNYTGPTGGLLTAGEQCAYAVNACVTKR